MDLQRIVDDLCSQVPSAIGAILCDYEGEVVVSALGRAPAPPGTEAHVASQVPTALADAPPADFLIRLAGAEPCGLLRLFDERGRKRGGGDLARLELRYETVEMLIDRLPNDFYFVLVMRRPAITGEARHRMLAASRQLAEYVT